MSTLSSAVSSPSFSYMPKGEGFVEFLNVSFEMTDTKPYKRATGELSATLHPTLSLRSIVQTPIALGISRVVAMLGFTPPETRAYYVQLGTPAVEVTQGFGPARSTGTFAWTRFSPIAEGRCDRTAHSRTDHRRLADAHWNPVCRQVESSDTAGSAGYAILRLDTQGPANWSAFDHCADHWSPFLFYSCPTTRSDLSRPSFCRNGHRDSRSASYPYRQHRRECYIVRRGDTLSRAGISLPEDQAGGAHSTELAEVKHPTSSSRTLPSIPKVVIEAKLTEDPTAPRNRDPGDPFSPVISARSAMQETQPGASAIKCW